MYSLFNMKQADSLASFFYDLAKGITLGIFGFSNIPTNTTFIIKIINIVLSTLAVYGCIRIGLKLQEEREINAI